MDAHNLVPDRELCEEMQRLGIKFPDSHFVWIHKYDTIKQGRIYELFVRDEDDKVNKHIPAPTSDEMGMVLPEDIDNYPIDYYKNCGRHTVFIKFDNRRPEIIEDKKKEANVKSKTLIWLSREGYLEGK